MLAEIAELREQPLVHGEQVSGVVEGVGMLMGQIGRTENIEEVIEEASFKDDVGRAPGLGGLAGDLFGVVGAGIGFFEDGEEVERPCAGLLELLVGHDVAREHVDLPIQFGQGLDQVGVAAGLVWVGLVAAGEGDGVGVDGGVDRGRGGEHAGDDPGEDAGEQAGRGDGGPRLAAEWVAGGFVLGVGGGVAWHGGVSGRGVAERVGCRRGGAVWAQRRSGSTPRRSSEGGSPGSWSYSKGWPVSGLTGMASR